MKASKLANKLQELISKHGDLDVKIPVIDDNTGDFDLDVHGISIAMNEDRKIDKVESFLICDKDTLEAFL